MQVGFVEGAAALSVKRNGNGKVACRAKMVRMGAKEPQRTTPGWKVGALAVAGVVLGWMGNPMQANAGIFGSSKMRLSETEKVTSGVMTIGAGMGCVYLAYRRNRSEDEDESQKIRDEAQRLEDWKQEFEQTPSDEPSGVSNEDLMASLRDRLKKEEAAPGQADDVERLNRLFNNPSETDTPSTGDEKDTEPKKPSNESKQ